MKDYQFYILSGNIFLACSFLTTKLSSSIFLGVLFCLWFLMGINKMGKEK